jgi:hypothetical protein
LTRDDRHNIEGEKLMANQSKNVQAEPTQPSDRRNFMRSTVAAATGLAVGGLAAPPVAAADEPAAGEKKMAGTITARFPPRHPPTDRQVHEVLAAIFRRNGCPTCGLTGIDLRMRVADPVEQVKVDGAELAGVEIHMEPVPVPWKAQ